jgi:hypothetical protein
MSDNLPNLLIIGAAKSGTTSLHNYLNQHPDIFMCSPKEPHFLINKEIGVQRIPNAVVKVKDYKKLFEGHQDKCFRGESSVMYLSFPEITIANIEKYLSVDVKIIIMLRNPVDRAYSGYQHVKRYNVMESLSFEDALSQSENRYHKTNNMTPASRYLELGMYYEQVKKFSEKFNNIHIIIYDDYKVNFKEEINKVFKFLNLSSVEVNTKQEFMVGGWEWKNEKMKEFMVKPNVVKSIMKILLPSKKLRKSIRDIFQQSNIQKVEKINTDTEKWLKDYYRKDIEKLSILLKKNLNYWTI